MEENQLEEIVEASRLTPTHQNMLLQRPMFSSDSQKSLNAQSNPYLHALKQPYPVTFDQSTKMA